jgi:putative addiction module component (TIGR02574 family)
METARDILASTVDPMPGVEGRIGPAVHERRSEGYHRAMGHPAIDIDSMAPEERLKLIGELWDSLQRTPESIPFPEAHRKELDARLDAIERGEAEVVEWDEVLRRLRQ